MPGDLKWDEEAKCMQEAGSAALPPPKMVWEKMSKSKHNGVNPQQILNEYGADITRLSILFKAPPESSLEWESGDVIGQVRWVNRVWALYRAYTAEATTKFRESMNKEDPKSVRDGVHRQL